LRTEQGLVCVCVCGVGWGVGGGGTVPSLGIGQAGVNMWKVDVCARACICVLACVSGTERGHNCGPRHAAGSEVGGIRVLLVPSGGMVRHSDGKQGRPILLHTLARGTRETVQQKRIPR